MFLWYCCCCCFRSILSHIWQWELYPWAALTRTHLVFLHLLFSYFQCSVSRFITTASPLPSPLLSRAHFLTCPVLLSVYIPLLLTLSLSLSLSLSPSFSLFLSLSLSSRDLLAMNQGWGSVPEERWEHSGKWLFPARLHHIRKGNGRRACVCVCVCAFVCLCVSPLSDQLGIS